jgi:ceramide glucosyltransferase
MTVLSVLPLAWSATVAVVSIHAMRSSVEAWKPRRAQEAQPVVRHTEVLVVRPCRGAEPRLEHTLASFAEAKASFRTRIALAVESPDDEAAPYAERAREALARRGFSAEVHYTNARGPNHKADQLARVLARSGAAEIVIVADSDVDLTGTDLDALVAPLLVDASLGATWAPPVEVSAPTTFGDHASHAVLSGSLHAFPLLGLLDGAGLVGKLVAVRGSALAKAGGFGALVDYLGEDMELARRLAERGYASRMVPIHARSVVAARTLGAVLTRFARWIAVIRGQRPLLLASYPGLFAATPLLLVAAAVAALEVPLAGLAAALVALVSRAAVALAARRAAGFALSVRALLFDVALADLVLLAAFARALWSRQLVWRGNTLRLGETGVLERLGRHEVT